MIRRTSFLSALAAATAAGTIGVPESALADAMTPARRAALTKFLGALAGERYDAAFALLSAKEQRYFGNAANYGSIFAADKLKLNKYTVLSAKAAPGGALASVTENVEFYDYTHQQPVVATARVAYGLLDEGGGVRLKDPFHPWRAIAPQGADVTTQGVKASLRKISFFTGYLELLVTFANVGDNGVSILPFGRSTVRDDKGHVYHPIESNIDQLSDRQFRLGLLLPSAGQYTGSISFFTPNRFTPASLGISFAPALRDGGDEPFTLDLPALTI